MIKVSRIIDEVTPKLYAESYSVCLLKDGVRAIEIGDRIDEDASNSIFFLHPEYNWRILKRREVPFAGYILWLDQETLDNPLLSKLHIQDVRLFSNDTIPKINLAPGIEPRVHSILEMLDELSSSHLTHKEDAVISLLNTFFVYCDGQCNIKSVISESNTKKLLVYKFKRLVSQNFNEVHSVNGYARMMDVTSNYLNECVSEVLGVNAKSIIIEQLVRCSRHALKFSDKSIKEICFEMGFSSPDYFSSFLKSQTGMAPSVMRQS